MEKAFILDCSVAMSWCFEDEFDEYAQQVLNSFKRIKALVPSLWVLEVTNVLLMAEKRNRLKPAESIRFLELLESLPIFVSDVAFSNAEVITVARNHKLTSYDSVYLLLAMHEGSAIATKDKAMKTACLENGVPIFSGI
jgi:predicted nucleic acid-binding protein